MVKWYTRKPVKLLFNLIQYLSIFLELITSQLLFIYIVIEIKTTKSQFQRYFVDLSVVLKFMENFSKITFFGYYGGLA